jgi:hypothetical protein
MATEKTPNYTAEQTAALREAYTAAPTRETVAVLAERFGKTAKSIIAKLTREGVYQAKQYVSKTGEKPVKKDEQADAIGAVLKLSEGEADSLAKANKTALAKIFKALANSVPVEPETDGERMAKVQAIQTIAERVGLDSREAESLTRANVAACVKIAAALATV